MPIQSSPERLGFERVDATASFRLFSPNSVGNAL